MAYSVKNIKLLRNGKLYSDLATAKSSIEAYVKITKGSENLDGVAILGRYNNDTQVSTVLGLVYSSGDTANITYVDSLSITNDITTINNNILDISSKIDEITGGTSGSIAEQIKKAIEALDYSDTAVSGQYVSSVSETDGVISVTREKLIASAITYNDTTVDATLTKLMNYAYPLTINASIAGAGVYEIGTTTSVTISNFSATVEGKSVTITAKNVNGTAVAGTSYSETGITSNKTFSISISAEGQTKSKTLGSVTFVAPIYIGFSTANTPSEATMLALSSSKKLLQTSQGTTSYTGTASKQYFWIFTPYSVSSVTTSGIECISDFTVTKNAFTYEGKSYNCYGLVGATASGEYTYTIK